MKGIKNDFSALEKPDIYSMAMFMLYKLIDDDKYCTLGELPYVLDKKNMLSFCTYFGGQTIKVPTVEEIHSILHIILLYQYVHIDGMTFEEAIRLVGYSSKDTRSIKNLYNRVSKVLENYEFKHRN